MKEVICINCARSFTQSPRHKNQNYCKRQECQRANKADWQRQKMRTDPEYRANQKLSNQKWRESHHDWKKERLITGREKGAIRSHSGKNLYIKKPDC